MFHIVLRADAGLLLGYGHVMRCLTLGRELRARGHSVTLVSAENIDVLASRALRFGIKETRLDADGDESSECEVMQQLSPDLLIVDGYDFSDSYFVRLQELGLRHMVIDDNATAVAPYACLILNPNPHATSGMYPAARGRLLLGPDYALVRHEILEVINRRVHPSTVFIAIGGTDFRDIAAQLAGSLAEHGVLRIVAATAQRLPGISKAPQEIATALGSAAIAIIGAGGTMWEACYLGVPAIGLVVADNQVAGARLLEQRGIAEIIDCRSYCPIEAIVERTVVLLAAPARRAAMSSLGRKLIDGQGVHRVADAVEAAIQ